MKILAIEDEERLAKGLKTGLEKQGFTVDYVLDGAEGQKRINLYADTYDLILLDLMLPKKSGESICKDTREKGIKTPILILSAKGMVEDKIALLNMGADDYVIKPFSFEELIARIKALLRRPEEVLPTVLKAENVELDTSSRQVLVNGKEIQLTLKEFVLLEYLMRSKGRVLTREQIYDALWDFADDSFSNVIDVHIKNLRKKLNDNSQNPKLLKTVRGVGYKIKDK